MSDKPSNPTEKKNLSIPIIGAIAGVIIVALIVAFFVMRTNENNAIVEELSTDLTELYDASTETLLEYAVDVELGEFTVTTNQYDIQETVLEVTITNNLDAVTSYTVQIEAVDANGDRIEEDYIYASKLSSGQSQTLDAFTYVDDEDIADLQVATFQIVSVTAYRDESY